jgi:hypothetical protein
MENISLSFVADICGIIGFVLGLFALNGVRNINKRINNTDNSVSQSASGYKNKQKIETNK